MNAYSGMPAASGVPLIGIRLVIALVVTTASLAWLVAHGDRSWFVGVVATVPVLCVAFIVAVYVIHYRNAMRKFKTMGDPQATLAVAETSLTLSSGAGSTTVPWSAVTEIWQFPGFLADVLLKEPVRHVASGRFHA